jgi:putative DNA primase/helicase
MFRSDASLLASLAGCAPDIRDSGYDLSRASAAFRPVAERLLAAGHSQRQAIWDEFLARCSAQAGVSAAGPESNLDQSVAHHSPAVTERGVRMTCVTQFEPRKVEWLWANRIPLGMITILAGDPKLGKSFVTLALAAAVSRGLPLPQSDLPDRPASAILMSAEDDPARTIAPRLVAAGADLSKIHIIESIELANGSEALPSLRADIDAVSAAATRLGDCRLIVIDPVAAYLGGVDDNRNAALRGVLSPLKSLAERLRAAVVLVSHLTKAPSQCGKHRIVGSIAYLGACRASFLFVPDPRDRSGRRVLMVDNGGNAAPLAPTLAYTIEDSSGRGPQVIWSDEPVTIGVDEALRPRRQLPAKRHDSESTECQRWLRETLAAASGRMLATEVRRAGKEAGFPWRTIQHARTRVRATKAREGFGPGSKVYWQLGKG